MKFKAFAYFWATILVPFFEPCLFLNKFKLNLLLFSENVMKLSYCQFLENSLTFSNYTGFILIFYYFVVFFSNCTCFFYRIYLNFFIFKWRVLVRFLRLPRVQLINYLAIPHLIQDHVIWFYCVVCERQYNVIFVSVLFNSQTQRGQMMWMLKNSSENRYKKLTFFEFFSFFQPF